MRLKSSSGHKSSDISSKAEQMSLKMIYFKIFISAHIASRYAFGMSNILQFYMMSAKSGVFPVFMHSYKYRRILYMITSMLFFATVSSPKKSFCPISLSFLARLKLNVLINFRQRPACYKWQCKNHIFRCYVVFICSVSEVVYVLFQLCVIAAIDVPVFSHVGEIKAECVS